MTHRTRSRRGDAALWLALSVGLMTADPARVTAGDPGLVAVEAVMPTPRAVSADLALAGTIQARVQSNIAFRTDGRVTAREVEVGQHVTADQVLATVDATEQRADMANAKAALASAQALVVQAETTFKRQQSPHRLRIHHAGEFRPGPGDAEDVARPGRCRGGGAQHRQGAALLCRPQSRAGRHRRIAQRRGRPSGAGRADRLRPGAGRTARRRLRHPRILADHPAQGRHGRPRPPVGPEGHGRRDRPRGLSLPRSGLEHRRRQGRPAGGGARHGARRRRVGARPVRRADRSGAALERPVRGRRAPGRLGPRRPGSRGDPGRHGAALRDRQRRPVGRARRTPAGGHGRHPAALSGPRRSPSCRETCHDGAPRRRRAAPRRRDDADRVRPKGRRGSAARPPPP